MKKSKYQVFIETDKDLYLYFNSANGVFLLLNNEKHNIYQNSSIEDISTEYPHLYNMLFTNGFIIKDDYDEDSIIEYKKLLIKADRSLYHVVINTTLDCNLKCWYCYETRVHHSNLRSEVIEAIKNNIVVHFQKQPYRTLKLSFFGGEPFLNFNAIKEILIFAKTFCEGKDINLIADFTTNSTVIRPTQIDFLKNFNCYFQITLDGDREKHNIIKSKSGEDYYEKTIKCIHSLSSEIQNSKIWIRINYDEETLKRIDNILEDISDLDKNRNFLILRKVWQKEANTIDSVTLIQALDQIMKHGFFVDCYALSRHNICFAERLNQVLVNYDGKIFKCSTISDFDDNNALGRMDLSTGEVLWDVDKICHITKSLKQHKCDKCGLYASCFGPCNKNLIKGQERTCILEEMNLSMRDYLMYNFKLHIQGKYDNKV